MRVGPNHPKDERRDGGAIYRSRALLSRLLPVLARFYARPAGTECRPVFGVVRAGGAVGAVLPDSKGLLFLQESNSFRFCPATEHARSAVKAGAMGNFRAVQADSCDSENDPVRIHPCMHIRGGDWACTFAHLRHKIDDLFNFLGFIVIYLNVPKWPNVRPSVHP